MSRTVLTPLVMGGAFIVAVLLVILTAVLVWISRPEPTPLPPSTAVLNVLPAASATAPLPTAAPPQVDPNAAAGDATPLPEGDIHLDAYVVVTGTGGDGLRLRIDPGLTSDVRLLGADGEIFQVRDGPVDADDFTWWYLVGVEDESRRGWAVSNYLDVVPEP